MVQDIKLERKTPRLNNTQFITELMDYSELWVSCAKEYLTKLEARKNG